MKYRKNILVPILLILLVLLPFGCAKDKQSVNEVPAQPPHDAAPFPISIMTTSFTKNPAGKDSPVLKEVEKYTNTVLDIQWGSNSSYEDELNLAFASGDLPDVVLITSKSSGVITAARTGAFYELTPWLDGYENLRQANQTVLNNVRIDNQLFGIPRMRTLGRYGVVYRKDWLDNTGLAVPKTIDDFYAMLKAFTENDPDQNEHDDTYGLILTNMTGSLDIMQTWFGVPKDWGVSTDGKLVPAHLTGEYREAMRFFRKIYEEKLVNQDFPLFDPERWNDPFVTGRAGCIVDVLDRANTIVGRLERIGGNRSMVDVFAAVSGRTGLKNLSTSGYNGFYAISGRKSESELKTILAFFNKLNDRDMQDLLYHGIEDRHYIVKNGEVTRQMAEGVSETERNDLSMLLTFIPRDLTTPVAMDALRKKILLLQTENEKNLVSNPAESFTSEVYSTKGNFLDDLISDARMKYITGEIDDSAFENTLDIWLESGGSQYIQEINAQYAAQQQAEK